MKSVVLKENFELAYSEEQPIPKPGPGEVLIKVEMGVILPSDTYCMSGQYNGEFAFPFTPGSEGSGTVIENGGGLHGWYL